MRRTAPSWIARHPPQIPPRLSLDPLTVSVTVCNSFKSLESFYWAYYSCSVWSLFLFVRVICIRSPGIKKLDWMWTPERGCASVFLRSLLHGTPSFVFCSGFKGFHGIGLLHRHSFCFYFFSWTDCKSLYKAPGGRWFMNLETPFSDALVRTEVWFVMVDPLAS